ncbi:hypothetical protein PJL18_04097 [Paenarthrobacter nicotinovorans]|nr:hypothetical protein [Paenarthrobacter nicotinovorans]
MVIRVALQTDCGVFDGAHHSLVPQMVIVRGVLQRGTHGISRAGVDRDFRIVHGTVFAGPVRSGELLIAGTDFSFFGFSSNVPRRLFLSSGLPHFRLPHCEPGLLRVFLSAVPVLDGLRFRCGRDRALDGVGLARCNRQPEVGFLVADHGFVGNRRDVRVRHHGGFGRHVLFRSCVLFRRYVAFRRCVLFRHHGRFRHGIRR